jgi:GNAT superfamily N-acetyltransferase
MRLRHVRPLDYDRVLAVIDDWWDGRPMSVRLSHVFFSHFAPTSFVIEDDGQLVGFLLGFLSQMHPDEAYVNFVGVHPGYRRLGLGRRLYERFSSAAQLHGRHFVRSITSPANTLSIEFHRGMGFRMLHGDAVIDGVPVWFDYAGAGGHRVVFRREIGAAQSTATRSLPQPRHTTSRRSGSPSRSVTSKRSPQVQQT